MSDSGWKNNVLSIQVSKAGKNYIKVNQDITLKEGSILTLEKKEDAIDKSVARGNISEDRGMELKEKLSFIKYEAHLAPEKK